MSAITCSGNHKTRLFIGDGNFSYTQAFIEKHDSKVEHNEESSLAHSIISTELVSKIHCSMCDLISSFEHHQISSTESENTTSESTSQDSCDDCSSIISRIENLKSKGATILLGINATSISTHEAFKEKKFARIHWNCPHDGSNFQHQTLPVIILNFFRECSKMQDPKGRIHITLAQPAGKKNFYQGYVYDISQAARQIGYTLIKKRKFETSRYPGYQHTQTNSNSKASVTDKGMREFIFEKIEPKTFEQITEAAKNPQDPKKILIKERLVGLSKVSQKACTISSDVFYQKKRFYYSCSSDDDSSDCEL